VDPLELAPVDDEGYDDDEPTLDDDEDDD
jgi:hypothetical protein